MSVLYLCGAGNSEGVRLALRANQEQHRWDRLVLVDDDPAKHGQSILGVEIVGPFAMLERVEPEEAEVVNLVARTTAKRLSARCRIERYGLPFATLIHPSVDMTGSAHHGDITVYQNATVGPLVSLGCSSVVFMGAVVGHGSQLGEGCVVAPNAVINARVRSDDGVYVGTNATILPDVKIGAWATIAAGSVVMKNVPEGATVMGNPAKTLPPLARRPPSEGPARVELESQRL